MNLYAYEDSEEKRREKLRAKHYYGDTVRSLFITGAIIMAIMLPIFTSQIPLPTPLAIGAIIIIGLMAGFTDPKRHWVAWVNVCICVITVLIAESTAIQAYADYSAASLFFWFNQVIVVIFFIALYFSVKTLRGML